ncbi:MAG: epimerase [Acidobacteria bacterium]|nr:MAG: epimerase [Acidobacteriota bacterium]
MQILITGPTGTAGSQVVSQALLDPEIEAVTALSRRPLAIEHPKLRTIVHDDFLDFSGLVNVFQNQDACLWCLGISQTQVTKEEYERITFNYALEAAKALLKANPSATFVFLSGSGADSTEQSRSVFARIKGKTENALRQLGLRKLFIARPGGIRPVHLNPNTALVNKLAAPLLPLMEFFAPNLVIGAGSLAKALLHIAKHGADKEILENIDLKRISQS